MRRQLAGLIDRRAIVAIALDRHEQVEPADPGRQEAQQVIALARRIVAGVERREPREEPDAHLERDRDRRRVADRSQPAPAQRAKLRPRRVRVDPHRPADRALDPAQIVEPVVARRQVVKPRDPAEPGVVERRAERREPVRDVLILPAHPRDAARRRAGVPRAWRLPVEPARLAPRRDRVGVIVVIVGAQPEEHLRLVVDPDRDHRPVGRQVRPHHLGDRRVPRAHSLAKHRARVRRHRPRARRRRHPDRRAARAPRLARRIGEHVIGHPEARQLGVDVRPRAQHDAQPLGVRRLEEPRQIALALPVQVPGGRLVDPPRHVGLDDRQAELVHRAQARRPARRRHAPVVHRAGVERKPSRRAGRISAGDD